MRSYGAEKWVSGQGFAFGWSDLFFLSPSSKAIGGCFMAKHGSSLCDVWASWALCLPKNCQKQNNLGVWNSASIPQNSTYTRLGVYIPLLFLYLCGHCGHCCWAFFPSLLHLLPHPFLWMHYVQQFPYQIKTLLPSNLLSFRFIPTLPFQVDWCHMMLSSIIAWLCLLKCRRDQILDNYSEELLWLKCFMVSDYLAWDSFLM